MNLSNKTVLLTGAARGLGRELARLLDGEGCSLIQVDRDGSGLEAVQAVLTRPAVSIRCDLSDIVERRELITTLSTSTEKLDILINCAGVGSHSGLSQMTVEEVERVMQINALAPLELMAGLRPLMPADGLIVNIGSIVGDVGVPSIGLYAASKAALHIFTRSVALEGVSTLLVVLGPLRDTGFASSIAHPRTGQPGWYRRLDLSPETVSRHIVQAMKRGHARLVLPGWYSFVISFARVLGALLEVLPARLRKIV
jgi:short-subunit dehydrogenase